MMETALEDHAQRIKEYLSLNLSESDTRAYLIDPLLHILGYKDVSDLRREVPIPATKETLDYELLVHDQPVAIVEAKALRHHLNDQHAAQCVQYASVLGVRWCLITNGISWALYDAYCKGPLTEKRITEVMLDGDQAELEKAWEVLSLFSREALGKTNPLQRLLIERVVADELMRPNSPAIEALRRATKARFGERISGDVVVEVTQQLIKKEQASVPKSEGTQFEPVRIEIKTAKVPQGEIGSSPSRTKDKPGGLAEGGRRIALSDLINSALLPSDAVLEVQIRGVKFTGQI